MLIVIANGDFFYREYADPREELERAGIRITVAAGRKSSSRPHQSSGEDDPSAREMGRRIAEVLLKQ